jgi:beta-glucanase (GH16 family)
MKSLTITSQKDLINFVRGKIMKVGLSSVPSHQRRCQRLLKIALIGIVAFLAFYPLTGCTTLQNKSNATATPTHSSTLGSKVPTKKLLWSEEFDGPKGSRPDPHIWTAEIDTEGWGNNQLDYDTDNQNVYQDGQGNLVIEARKESSPGVTCWYGPCQYTSAQISTKGHFSFTYGLLEARIKIPYGQGLWSAFWLRGDNCDKVGWPKCGEIDIMENVGKEPRTIHGTVHGPGNYVYSGTYDVPHGRVADDFHVYGLQWDPGHLYFFIDGINYYTLERSTLTDQNQWVFDHPFHIVLNVPVGGTWPGRPNSTTVFPQRMYISYLRLYANE